MSVLPVLVHIMIRDDDDHWHRVPAPTRDWQTRTGVGLPGPDITRRMEHTPASLRKPRGLLDSCIARPLPARRRPDTRAAQAFPRGAFRVACHAPSGFAAGALRLPHDPGASVPRLSSLSLSLSLILRVASHPRVWSGESLNTRAASAEPVLAIPPPIPTPAHGAHCPPIAALWSAP